MTEEKPGLEGPGQEGPGPDRPELRATPEGRLTEAGVVRYLKNHPDFLDRHPELFETLTPPAIDQGSRVVDFQTYAIRNLQQKVRHVETTFSEALTYARDNVSVQGQVHEAVLRMSRARSLDHLLEVITVDLGQIFDADVVRLGLESEIADLYESYHPESHYSGLVFLGAGASEMFFGDKTVLLFADTEKNGGFLIEELFQNCTRLALSAAMLRLELPTLGRSAVLGFGVRFKGRYEASQAVDLLEFLAEVLAERLDQCLLENGLEL